MYKTKPKQVIIAGGGYAGIQAALSLEHLLKGSYTKISLIDKNAYHTLLPSLPEIISNRGFSIIDHKDIAVKELELNAHYMMVHYSNIEDVLLCCYI